MCISIGIFFGRIANFINGELVGKITNVSWSVIFPRVDLMPRHPSQLYEAFLEGLILFFIMNLFLIRKNYKIGTCSCMFLIFYGIFRIISEYFREPDVQVGYFSGNIKYGYNFKFCDGCVWSSNFKLFKEMKSNLKFLKNSKILSGERFFQKRLYDKKFGYYTSKNPFGKNGDFITSPKISKLFSEIIAVWIVSTWEIFGKPKKFNIVELGPGDGSLIKRGLEVLKNFLNLT